MCAVLLDLSQTQLTLSHSTDMVPTVLIFLASLISSLALHILTPLYNSFPLSLHTWALHIAKTSVLALTYWVLSKRKSAKEPINARACLGIAALGADAVVVFGRRVGSHSGALLGPQWGALAARFVLGGEPFWSLGMFAMLCMVCSSPVRSGRNTHAG